MPRENSQDGPARDAAPVPLSRVRIIDEAIALADREGIDAVSMRRLAAVLGVDPMSIYHHLRDKDALLDGMADALVSSINHSPSESHWVAELRTLVLDSRRTMLRHPWSARVLASRVELGPATIAHVDRLLGILRGGGCSLELTHHALHVLGSRALGFSQELFDDTASSEVDPALIAVQARAWAETMPHVAELALASTHDGVLGICDDDGEFAFALDLILEGLERRAAAEGATAV